MSDSLVLKGLKDVRKHTGSEMLLQRPPRGGDAYPVKKWWATNAAQTIYVGCSVFKVTAGGNDCFLAIDTAEMSTVRVDHDGSFNFSFFIYYCGLLFSPFIIGIGPLRDIIFGQEQFFVYHYCY